MVGNPIAGLRNCCERATCRSYDIVNLGWTEMGGDGSGSGWVF